MHYDEEFLKQQLSLQGIIIDETDLPHIKSILTTFEETKASLKEFPDLNTQKPITTLDMGGMKK